MRARALVVCFFLVSACDKSSSDKAKETATGTGTATGDAGAGKAKDDPGTLAATGAAPAADGAAAAPDNGTPTADGVIAQLEAYKTEACACTDAACANKVMEAFGAWVQKLEALEDSPLGEEIEDRGEPIHEAMMACIEKHQGAATAEVWEKALTEFAGLRDRMCACKDKACADEVEAALDAFEDRMKALISDKPSREIMERGDKIDDEYDACRDKLRGDDTGAAPKPSESAVDLTTGIPECDELMKVQQCIVGKSGVDMSKELGDMAKAWRDASATAAGKQAAADGCKAALEQGREVYKQQGCM